MEINNNHISCSYVNVYVIDEVSMPVKLLLLKRNAGIVMPEVWQVVSGKLENGESILDGFKNQVHKKTRLEQFQLTPLESVNTYFDSYYNKVMLVPSAVAIVSKLEHQNIILDNSLHSGHMWIPLNTTQQYLTFRGQKEVIEELKDMYNI